MAILGVPFLRAYAAKFDRSSKTISLAKVPPGSTACSKCGPGLEASPAPRDDMVFNEQNAAAMQPARMKAKVPHLPLHKIRLPSWLNMLANHSADGGWHVKL